MSIAPLQLPGACQSPSIDLAGGLSQLGQVYRETQNRQRVAKQDMFGDLRTQAEAIMGGRRVPTSAGR